MLARLQPSKKTESAKVNKCPPFYNLDRVERSMRCGGRYSLHDATARRKNNLPVFRDAFRRSTRGKQFPPLKPRDDCLILDRPRQQQICWTPTCNRAQRTHSLLRTQRQATSKKRGCRNFLRGKAHAGKTHKKEAVMGCAATDHRPPKRQDRPRRNNQIP